MTLRAVLTEERLARREHLPKGDLEELMRLARAHGGANELVAHNLAGWSHVLAGDFFGARQSAHAAFARAGNDLVSRVRIAILDAYAATALGLFEEADSLMAEMLHALEPSDHVVLMANTLVWYARLALLWGDIGAAKDYAAKGRELGRRLELPAELAGVELALAEVYGDEGALTECESAAAAARSYADAAWYSADRERAAALAELYRARAQFCCAGAAAALSTARSALAGDGVPAAQRVVILAEAAAYAKIASDAGWEKLRAAAEVALAEAQAGDALDALAIAAAAGILYRLRAEPASPAHELPIPSAVTATYGALLARRRDLALDGSVPARPGSRFAALLLEALSPVHARSEVHANGEPLGSKLTRREIEILELLAEGLTNKEIAQRFSVSPRTVDTHVERVLSKLNATTRTRAVAAAIRAGIVPLPSSLDLR
jgi:DNA-binding CsgD family transcriptional regulator